MRGPRCQPEKGKGTTRTLPTSEPVTAACPQMTPARSVPRALSWNPAELSCPPHLLMKDVTQEEQMGEMPRKGGSPSSCAPRAPPSTSSVHQHP